jgi:XTP/dITP diphosphohydrolase
MSTAIKLLIATTNPGKILELRELLADTGVDIVGLTTDLALEAPVENGATFAENARLKASYYASKTGMHTIADDSGLEVTVLRGRPGVLSARYGGDDATFDEKMKLLLRELESADSSDRTARFVCAVALADTSGNIVDLATGICTGVIADSPRGCGGFGYDPIFIPDGFDRTFAELPPEVKSSISHRANAISRMFPFLREFFRILT